MDITRRNNQNYNGRNIKRQSKGSIRNQEGFESFPIQNQIFNFLKGFEK